MDFWRAYRLLARRKWIIMAVVLLTTVLVGIGAYTKGKQYDAITRFGPTEYGVRKAVSVSILDEKNLPLLTEDNWTSEARRIATDVTSSDVLAEAVVGLANTGQLMEDVSAHLSVGAGRRLSTAQSLKEVQTILEFPVRRMDDETKATIFQKTGVRASNWPVFIYLGLVLKNEQGVAKLSNVEAMVERLYNDVQAERVKATPLNYRTVELSVRDPNPRIAEALATAMTVVYREKYNEDTLSTANKRVDDYKDSEEAAKDELINAQRQVELFKRRHNGTYIPEQVSSAIKVHEQAKNSLEDVNASLRDLDAQIIASRARLASIPRMLTHTRQEENPKIAQLRDQINKLSVDLADAQGTYTADHPDVKRLKARIASLQDELKGVQGTMLENRSVTENPEWLEREREIAGFVQRRQGLAARVATLNKVISEKEGIIDTLPETETAGDSVMRIYRAASERMTETSRKLAQAREDLKNAEAGSLNIDLLAGPDRSTMEPRWSSAYIGTSKTMMGLVALAFLLSLLGSAAIFLALDVMDTSVKTAVDVQRMLDSPVTGIVPRLPGTDRALMPRVTHTLPASPHAESYRFLGTDILLSAAEEPFKTVMVATAKPNQGGTATICNLAITLAQAGQSVALVDADLRRPSLHTIFNLSNEVGLSTVLGNGKLPSDALQRTDVDNLYVMTGGPAPENAWQLLRSPKMRETITDLARDFDFVLFDTPSAVVFADAATIATMVDGVLMVVRANEAPSGSEMQVKNLLNKTRARIVGVVLNDMPMEQVDSARYFEHYYNHDGKGDKAVAAGGSRPALPKRPTDDEI